MKPNKTIKQIIIVSILISLQTICYSQDFTYEFSGSNISLQNGTDYYNPMSASKKTEVIGNNFYALWDEYEMFDYINKIFMYGTDFNSSPIVEKTEGNYSYYHTLVATAKDSKNNLYMLVRFENQTTIENTTFNTSEFGLVLLKYSAQGSFIEGHVIDNNEFDNARAFCVNDDYVYIATPWTNNSTNIYAVSTSNYEDIQLIENTAVTVTNMELFGTHMYIGGSVASETSFTFGSFTSASPKINYETNSFIGHYSIQGQTIVPENGICFYNINEYEYNTLHEIAIDTDGTVYAVGSFNGDMDIAGTNYSTYENAQYIVSLSPSISVNWSTYIPHNSNFTGKLMITPHSIFVSSNYYTYSGEGSFDLEIGKKNYRNIVPYSQQGIYLAQIIKENGRIHNSTALFAYEDANGFDLYDMMYDAVNDKVSIILNTNYESLYTPQTQSMSDAGNYHFVKATISNIQPTFFVDSNETLYDIFCNQEAALGLSIPIEDIALRINHPTEDIANISISIKTSPHISYTFGETGFTITSYDKVQKGIDTITIIATDPLNNIAKGYIYFYVSDQLTFSWDSLKARRCIGGTEMGPNFYTTELNLPEIVERSIYNFNYDVYTYEIYDSQADIRYNWYDDIQTPGINEFQAQYDITYYRNYYDQLYEEGLTCSFTEIYSTFKINDYPILTNTIPSTFCSSIDLNNYVSIPNGTFYANENEMYYNTNPIKNEFFSYPNFGNISIDYIVADPISGCGLNEYLGEFNVTQAPVQISFPNEHRTCEHDNIITLNPEIPNIIWYGNANLTTILSTDQSYIVPTDTELHQKVWITQSSGGCESVPLEIAIDVFPLPTVSFTGKTVLCNEEQTTRITIDTDARIEKENLRVYWNGNLAQDLQFQGPGDEIAAASFSNTKFLSTYALLDLGTHSLEIEDIESGCYNSNSISITESTLTPPIVQDTSFTIGSPSPKLTAIGNDIRWFKEDESLIGAGNTLQTRIRTAGSYTFLATQSDEFCESAYDTANVTMLPCPATKPVYSVDTITYCYADEEITLHGENESTRWFQDNLKIVAIGTDSTLAIQMPTPGTYTYYMANYNSTYACYGATTPLTLQIFANPVITTAIPSVSNEIEEFDVTSYVYPQGGTFAGTFITNNTFNASQAGEGIHTIEYTYSDANNCSATKETDITVTVGTIPAISIHAALDTVYITKNQTIQLQAYAFPTNATAVNLEWSISDETKASLTQEGLCKMLTLDTLFAVVTNTLKPTQKDTVVLIGNAPEKVTCIPLPPLCLNDKPIKLNGGLPAGGKYFGTHVSNNTFNPIEAGGFEIGYTYTDIYGNTDTAYTFAMVTMVFKPEVANITATEYGTIPNITAIGDSIVWYDSYACVDTIQTGKELEHGKTAQGTYTFYAVQIGMGCASEPTIATLTIIPCILQQPTIAQSHIIQCENDETSQSFVATATESVLWYNSANIEVHQGNTFTPDIQNIGTSVWYARHSNGQCLSSPVQVTYTRSANPTVVLTGTDSIVIGKPYTIDAEITHANAYTKVWTLNEQALAQASNNVTQTFTKNGINTISLSVTDNATMCNTTASKSVTAFTEYVPVSSIECSVDTIEIVQGFTKTISAIVSPTYATHTKAIFVSHSSIVSCNDYTCNALQTGTTYIYATDDAGVSHDSIFVKVVPYIPVASIELPKTITVYLQQTKQVAAIVYPSNASFPEITFSTQANQFLSISPTGLITGNNVGTWLIEAKSTVGGISNQCLVHVIEEPIQAQEIILPQEIHIVKGEQKSVSYETVPSNADIDNFVWTIADETISTWNAGVLAGLSKGTTTLTATHPSTNEEYTSTIRVTNSQAPVCNPFPRYYLKQANDSIEIQLAQYAWDDSTATNDLIVQTEQTNICSVRIEGMKITILPNNSEFTGITNIAITVTDEEGSSATSTLTLVIEPKENEAPIILAEPIYIEFAEGVNTYNLLARVRDDFSKPEEILWTAEGSEHIGVELQEAILTVSNSNTEWFGPDTITLTATDRHLATTTARIPVIVTNKPNSTPVIAHIPPQYNNDTVFFSYIELSDYVSDDFTSPADIVWTCSPNANIKVKIFRNIGFIQITNPYWSGAEILTLTATDEHGAQDVVEVLFVQEQARNQGWNNTPAVNFFANKRVGVPGDVFTLYGSLGGAQSWKWNIENGLLTDSSKIIQTVSFANPGSYTVQLTAQNPDGEETIVKEDYITVYGITNRTPAICIGESIELALNTTQADSYVWNTGDTTSSINVSPQTTAVYSVTLTKGLFSFTDSVQVRVSVPVTLGVDTALCDKTEIVFDAGNYQSFVWNTGAITQTIPVSELGTYSVTTTDELGCVSTASRSITKIFELPHISLGDDITLCDGEIALLDAGIGYSYVWSNNAKDQQVLITTPQTLHVTITDNNMCSNSDTITVHVKYPYTEQIGVVTYSEKTNNIIVAWQRTPGKNTMKYEVYRETNIKDKWSFIGEVPYSELSVFEDSLSNYVMRAYRYGLVTVDSCGNRSPMSIAHRSMHLQTYYDNGMNLRWSLYEPLDYVETYIVYRGTSLQTMVAVDSLANDYYSWTDTLIDPDMLYRVVFRLKETVDPKLYNDFKIESGPFVLAMSNIAEAQTSIGDIDFDATVFAYPNPVIDVVNIVIAGTTPERYTVRIYNTSGSTLHLQQTDVLEKTMIHVPTTAWAQGTYYIQVSNSTGSKTLQIVK